MAYTNLNRFHEILDEAVKSRCSDVHLTANKRIFLRRRNKLFASNSAPFSEDEMKSVSVGILNEEQKRRLLQDKAIDCAYAHNGRRFRINVHTSLSGLGMAVRLVGEKAADIDSFAKAELLKKIILKRRGLVLVCGATGTGKSTTLASMIDYLNHCSEKHIVTLEDPIEYLFFDEKSLIHQKEYGRDFTEFAAAVRMAMRQDPDVIMIGEIRDAATMRAALEAAETGHLVLGTLHSSSCAEALMRIEGFFVEGNGKADFVRMQTADCLNSVVVQQLLPLAGGELVCCMEIMMANSAIRNIIRRGCFEQIYSQMQLRKKEGMCTMRDAAAELMKDNPEIRNYVDF